MRSFLGSVLEQRIVLECGACHERTVLGGPEDVWRSGRVTFECGGCGRGLTLADRLPEGRPGAIAGHAGGGLGKAGPRGARGGRVAAGG